MLQRQLSLPTRLLNKAVAPFFNMRLLQGYEEAREHETRFVGKSRVVTSRGQVSLANARNDLCPSAGA